MNDFPVWSLGMDRAVSARMARCVGHRARGRAEQGSVESKYALPLPLPRYDDDDDDDDDESCDESTPANCLSPAPAMPRTGTSLLRARALTGEEKVIRNFLNIRQSTSSPVDFLVCESYYCTASLGVASEPSVALSLLMIHPCLHSGNHVTRDDKAEVPWLPMNCLLVRDVKKLALQPEWSFICLWALSVT